MIGIRRHASLLLLFVAFTIVTTYPQVWSLARSVPYHTDPYFSMWRLGWVATHLHQPSRLFESNIFYPEHDTFAFSDAMLLPGAAVAPLSWAGVDIVLIYNLALLGSLALSGYAMARLAMALTGHAGASIVAGLIYAFAPWRFDHYVHLELQITFWIPLALLYLHRVIERGRAGDAVMFGLLTAAQALSSIYMALFLSLYCAIVAPLLWWIGHAHRSWATVRTTVFAALLAVTVSLPYGVIYVRASRQVGTRSMDDVRHYGATLDSYRSVPSWNRLYGSTLGASSRAELMLFPGVLAIALGTLGLVVGNGRARFAYVAGLLLTLEMTRGADGVLYPWLFEYVSVFRALRVPSRMGLFVNLSLSVLSAFGAAWLQARLRGRPSRLLATVLLPAILVIEYASAPPLDDAPPPTRVDRWLARQPSSVIVQLPLASTHNGGRSWDWLFMYQGLGHQQRMLNGMSGYVPASYHQMTGAMDAFPDERSMALLRDRGVDFVVLRGERYAANDWAALTAAVNAQPGLTLVARLPEHDYLQEVYRVER